MDNNNVSIGSSIMIELQAAVDRAGKKVRDPDAMLAALERLNVAREELRPRVAEPLMLQGPTGRCLKTRRMFLNATSTFARFPLHLAVCRSSFAWQFVHVF